MPFLEGRPAEVDAAAFGVNPPAVAQPAASDFLEEAVGAPDEAEAVRSVLDGFKHTITIYLEFNLPGRALHNAREASGVPPEERIVGLIDFTGDEDDASANLLFGATGIYFQTDGKRGAIPYAEFPRRIFVNHGTRVFLGQDTFLRLEDYYESFPCEQLTTLLDTLKQVLTDRLRIAQDRQPVEKGV
jgi:hypothetical protein